MEITLLWLLFILNVRGQLYLAGSFEVVVLQRMTKKCAKMYNARAESWEILAVHRLCSFWTRVIHFGTFLCHPLQNNNAKWIFCVKIASALELFEFGVVGIFLPFHKLDVYVVNNENKILEIAQICRFEPQKRQYTTGKVNLRLSSMYLFIFFVTIRNSTNHSVNPYFCIMLSWF